VKLSPLLLNGVQTIIQSAGEREGGIAVASEVLAEGKKPLLTVRPEGEKPGT